MLTLNEKYALVSVTDRQGLVELCRGLLTANYRIIATDGTSAFLTENKVSNTSIKQYLRASGDISLSGRLKTLYPPVFEGILSRNDLHKEMLEKAGYNQIDVIVCNLYAFASAIKAPDVKIRDAVESIDIGGVALLQAGATNYERVTVLCDPSDYREFLDQLETASASDLLLYRKKLALKALGFTFQYDCTVSWYLNNVGPPDSTSLCLRYGINPYQIPASVHYDDELPITILGGNCSYVNICDALNGWQLVKELKDALSLPSATSFKHVSPAGAAVSEPVSVRESRICLLLSNNSPLSCAYGKARGADRLASYGDFVALSDCCDEMTAHILKAEINEDYVPSDEEERMIFGVTLKQRRNTVAITRDLFIANSNIMTQFDELSEEILRDVIVATMTVKYTQSASVALAKNGQVIGVGSGQPCLLSCTKIACDKADLWWIRQHDKIIDLISKLANSGVKRTQIDHMVTNCIQGSCSASSVQEHSCPTGDEKMEWIQKQKGVVMSCDDFLSSTDVIRRASQVIRSQRSHRCKSASFQSGVTHVVAPGCSRKSQEIQECCVDHRITLILTGVQLFHH